MNRRTGPQAAGPVPKHEENSLDHRFTRRPGCLERFGTSRPIVLFDAGELVPQVTMVQEQAQSLIGISLTILVQDLVDLPVSPSLPCKLRQRCIVRAGA